MKNFFWNNDLQRNKMEATPEILRIGEKKEYLTNGIIQDDSMKLEPRVFERTDKI